MNGSAEARYALFRLSELLAELPQHLRAAGLRSPTADDVAADGLVLLRRLRDLREEAAMAEHAAPVLPARPGGRTPSWIRA